MAHWKNINASGNGLGGIYTNNPAASFENVSASGNGLYGIVDESGPSLIQHLDSLLDQLKASGDETGPIETEIQIIKQELPKDQPDKILLKSTWEALKGKMSEASGTIIGNAVWTLIQHGEKLIDAIVS